MIYLSGEGDGDLLSYEGGAGRAKEGGKLAVLLTVESNFLASCSRSIASNDGSCATVLSESPRA